MKKGRQNIPAKFNARIALEAVTLGQTLAELSTRHEVNAAMTSNWNKTLTDRADELFDTSPGHVAKTDEELTARLYQQIGELQSELSWLKKS